MYWGLTKIIWGVCWSVLATYCPTLNESEIENKMSEYTIKAGFHIDAWAVFKLLTTTINFKTFLSQQQLPELPQGQHQFARQGDQAHEDFQTHAIILMR